jgi:hypothetical protein
MLRPALLALLLGSAAWSEAVAQNPVPLQPGQRVRVQFADPRTPVLTGAVQAIGPDTLVVHPDGGPGAKSVTAIPLSSVAGLQVSRGRHSKWATGLLIGLGAGAVTGAILGATSRSDWLFTSTDMATIGAVTFGAVGGVVGVIIGALTKTERWEAVPIPRGGKHLAPVPTAVSPPGGGWHSS